MSTWVALLRGVNVRGTTMRSADLRAALTEAGFSDVRTVLASGNVVFATDLADPAMVESRARRALSQAFDYDAHLILLRPDALATAIEDSPFDEADADRQSYVVVCRDADTLAELLGEAAGLDPLQDPVAAGSGVVYWNPVKGTSTETPLAKILARSRYRKTTTTRNLRTLQKIAALFN